MVVLCSHRHPGKQRQWSPPAGNARRHERRRPEKTPLFGAVAAHLGGWLASRQARGEPVAGHVEDEFRAYLRCGILCHGFARARCLGCGHAFLISFSCKRRGVCPSCNGRRMAQTAAHLADHVIPPVPVRKILTHLGEPLKPPPASPARGPPTDWGELVQVHDDRAIFQASPDELPAIDIHSF